MTIKDARTLLGYTQHDVASRLGIHDLAYSRYEKYLVKPNVIIAQEIAYILRQPIEVIFREEYYRDRPA